VTLLKLHPVLAALQLLAVLYSYTHRVLQVPEVWLEHMTLLMQAVPVSWLQLVVHVSFAGSHMHPLAWSQAPCVV
jgi:hypothetical protein